MVEGSWQKNQSCSGWQKWSKKDREIDILHLLAHSKWPQQWGLGQAKARRFIWISQRDSRGPSIQAICRELEQKQSRQGINWCPCGMSELQTLLTIQLFTNLFNLKSSCSQHSLLRKNKSNDTVHISLFTKNRSENEISFFT